LPENLEVPTVDPSVPHFRRRLGEPSWEEIVIMPFTVGLWVAVLLRKWLRRRLGIRAGNVLGKSAMIVLGAPPLFVAYVLVRFLRLALLVAERIQAHVKPVRSNRDRP
jgi:uncharacterized membrane protein